MKRILLSIALLSSIYLSAQTVIVEEKFEKKNEPVAFQYLPISKKIVIYKGESISLTDFNLTKSGASFDANGKKDILFENEKFVKPTFSVTEKTIKGYDGVRFSSGDYKFYQNNSSSIIDDKILDNINSFYFGFYDMDNFLNHSGKSDAGKPLNASFNDTYDFGFTDHKERDDIDFTKDEIFLEVIEIKNNSKKRIQIIKPDLALLTGDSFAKDQYKTTFNTRLNGNENFDFITKSVSSDFRTTIIYKSTYNFEGKLVKELPLTLTLDNKFFTVSDNKGGYKYESGDGRSKGFFSVGTSCINNFLEDRASGDIYVYGIFSDNAPKKINGNCNPNGFYVFKFDKDGKKLWESINYIDGKEYFEKIKSNSYLSVNLFEYNKDFVFSVSVNSFTEFSYSTIVNKSTGSISKINFIEYNNAGNKAINKAFVSNTYVNDIRNKVFSQITFVAMITNPDVLKYINSVSDKGNRLYYEGIFSDQGIWLIETDNKEYYKILLFKD